MLRNVWMFTWIVDLRDGIILETFANKHLRLSMAPRAILRHWIVKIFKSNIWQPSPSFGKPHTSSCGDVKAEACMRNPCTVGPERVCQMCPDATSKHCVASKLRNLISFPQL